MGVVDSKPEVVNHHGTIITQRGTALYGNDHEVYLKLKSKEDPEQIKQVMGWLQQAAGHPLKDSTNLYEALRDGVVLCEIANKIRPGIILHYSKQAQHKLHQEENIRLYLKAYLALDADPLSSFRPSDLNEERGIYLVMQNICALSRQASKLGFFLPPVKLVPPSKKIALVEANETTGLLGGTHNNVGCECCIVM